MKCPYINPTPDVCLKCELTGCDGGKDSDTKEKQRRHYQKHIVRMRKYHRDYQKSTYNTCKNTEKCRQWREKNLDKKKQYDHERYLRKKAERVS